MSTIPAKAIVSVIPGVLPAGGSGLALNGLVLTTNTQVPIGAVQPFSNANDVGDYFGPSSDEYNAASIYFAGFDNSAIKPGRILFSQYNQDDVAAYLRGGPLGMTLAQLQAVPTGSLSIVMDGYTHAAASVDLSAASSFSNAASVINTAINASQPQAATSSAATISGTTLTVGGTITGTWAAGQTISGSGVTASSKILDQLSGTTGGAGTYQLDLSSTVGSPTAITASATPIVVTYDSVSGAFLATSGIEGVPSTAAYATGTIAAGIKLTQATGAVVSQGAVAAVPSTFMDDVVNQTQNWACFTSLFDPDNGSGNDVKMEFALWTTRQVDRWAYVAWDDDAAPLTVVPATGSMGQLLQAGDYSGTCLVYSPDYTYAVFVLGYAASIDFTQLAGRTTLAFRSQSGLLPVITNQTEADNLTDNGYNFYGAYGTANDEFVWMYNGLISGRFQWMDAYVNQIWMNAQFQLDLMLLLQTVRAVPYNAAGQALIEASLGSTIQQALAFQAFSPGVVLSSTQVAALRAEAGADISATLYSQGYYVQVGVATPQVRQNRQSPPCAFWYTDAGAVQKINLRSIAVQ